MTDTPPPPVPECWHSRTLGLIEPSITAPYTYWSDTTEEWEDLHVLPADAVRLVPEPPASPGADTPSLAAPEPTASDVVARMSMRPGQPLLPWPELPQDLAFLANVIDTLHGHGRGADTPTPAEPTLPRPIDLPGAPGSNTGHGHVYRRPDRSRARCGGPALCSKCAADAARKAEAERPAADPGYERIADAIAGALAAAELDVAVSRSGTWLAEPHLALARCLDKAGLIDWSAFGPDDETGPEA